MASRRGRPVVHRERAPPPAPVLFMRTRAAGGAKGAVRVVQSISKGQLGGEGLEVHPPSRPHTASPVPTDARGQPASLDPDGAPGT